MPAWGAGVPKAHLTSSAGGSTIGCMSSIEIDDYLADLDEPKRSTLQQLRRTILEVVPEAEEGISYQLPAFRLNGKVITGSRPSRTT